MDGKRAREEESEEETKSARLEDKRVDDEYELYETPEGEVKDLAVARQLERLQEDAKKIAKAIDFDKYRLSLAKADLAKRELEVAEFQLYLDQRSVEKAETALALNLEQSRDRLQRSEKLREEKMEQRKLTLQTMAEAWKVMNSYS